MNENEEFIEQLEELNQKKWKEIFEALKGVTGIYSIEFTIFPKEEILSKFKLNKDINFSVKTNNGSGKVEYFYKGMKLEPINYYIRPENYHEVSILEILQQCVLQDTHQPNIMFLERGEKFLNQ